ncbi:hypothetical protein S1OALGB6SA_325, partial [Olavius algarvensis spirochete endosymbiont]
MRVLTPIPSPLEPAPKKPVFSSKERRFILLILHASREKIPYFHGVFVVPPNAAPEVKFRHANASTDHLKISQACLNSLMTQKMEKKYPQNQKQVAKLLLWK